MSECKISDALDRFQEAHFWIHGMENFYHAADPFRWNLNAFIRSIKEIPQIVQMKMQNEQGFKDWFTPIRKELESDPLIKTLKNHRNTIVHKGMLIPNSSAMLGITKGRGLKLGMSFPIHPLEDSRHAMERYLDYVMNEDTKITDHMGVLNLWDEGTLPCIEREWKLEEFDEEIVDLCSQAWLKIGLMINQVLSWLNEEEIPDLSLGCRHSSQSVRLQMFDREELIKHYEDIKKLQG